MFCIIRSRDGEKLQSTHLKSETPDEIFFKGYLGKVRWLNNREVEVINKRVTKKWLVNIEE